MKTACDENDGIRVMSAEEASRTWALREREQWKQKLSCIATCVIKNSYPLKISCPDATEFKPIRFLPSVVCGLGKMRCQVALFARDGSRCSLGQHEDQRPRFFYSEPEEVENWFSDLEVRLISAEGVESKRQFFSLDALQKLMVWTENSSGPPPCLDRWRCKTCYPK